MSKMQGLQHISSEHVFWLNYAKCRIQLNTCKLNVFFFMQVKFQNSVEILKRS